MATQQAHVAKTETECDWECPVITHHLHDFNNRLYSIKGNA